MKSARILKKYISFSVLNKAICLVLFLYPGLSLADNQEEDNSGALRIESKTTLCSAGFNIKKARGENGDEEKDKERKLLGIGEIVTLTLTGKPQGKIKELTWSFESGGDLVNELTSEELKGKTKLTIAVKSDLSPDQLKQNSNITLKVTTSEGRTVSSGAFTVFFPQGMEGMHRGSGIPAGGFGNDSSATSPNASLLVTLQPESVNFQHIQIIERDMGSQPQGMSLDQGHKGQGVDTVVSIDDCNRFTDKIAGVAKHEEIAGKKHRLPQAWSWICSWRVLKGGRKDDGGKLTSKSDDIIQIGSSIEQSFTFDYIRNPQNPNSIIGMSGSISKFGCSAARASTDAKDLQTYLGKKESEQ